MNHYAEKSLTEKQGNELLPIGCHVCHTQYFKEAPL